MEAIMSGGARRRGDFSTTCGLAGLPRRMATRSTVKFQEAQTWCEESEEALGQNDSPSLVDVGVGFGLAVPSAQAGAHPPRPVMTPLLSRRPAAGGAHMLAGCRPAGGVALAPWGDARRSVSMAPPRRPPALSCPLGPRTPRTVCSWHTPCTIVREARRGQDPVASAEHPL
jgi:hypothetical protein